MNSMIGRSPTIAAPTPRPANPFSLIGVSILRCGQPHFLRVFVERIKLFVVQFSLARELSAQTRNRVVEPVFFQLLPRSITCRVGHRMSAVPVGADFIESPM